MIIFPAIDLLNGKAVRLFKGDYDKVTVYSDKPWETAKEFVSLGATHIHIVDLDGAKDGGTPNFDTVLKIKEASGAFCEIGGGIRTPDVVFKYLDSGIDRIILGTAAVENKDLLRDIVKIDADKVAVGADLKDGYVAVKGWKEVSQIFVDDFFAEMSDIGVKTIICTDISKDGAMQGTNRELYNVLSKKFNVNIVASGGVSSIDDVRALKEMGLHGAIIGKAYYTGAIDLKEACEVAK